MGPLYAIIFSGDLLDGFAPAQVKARFGERFGLKPAQLAQVFSGRAITLKKGLDAEQARRYLAELTAMGLNARSQSATGPVATTAAPAKAAPATPSAPGYRIVFDGKVLPGFSRESVMRQSASRLRFDARQQALLFSGQTVTIKRGLIEEKARTYIKTLRQMGMDVSADPALPRPDRLPSEISEPEAATEASLMETQFSASVPYNVQHSFDSSESLDMIRAALGEADDNPPLGNPRSAMMQTVINPEAIREYESALADDDDALAALRAAHDAPAAKPVQKPVTKVDFDFTAPPPAKAAPVAPVEPPPAPPPPAPAKPAGMPAPPPSLAPEVVPPAAARTTSAGTLVAGLVLAVVIALVLFYLNGG
ncbi:hypothetical protein [Denitromonas halophila]|uniref:Uncharacterized protein n=1 Tax=Denitromonas halophila TaxID=1629404 RepID=A0A557R0L5_9RHOO|nr:hypothetical protein [Denitromonas halophila]TVO58698.1 hypothetical protein FHP91_03270 [Denitromonas halophila]